MFKNRTIFALKILFVAVIFVQLVFSIYYYMFFDIKKHIISQKFRGDIAKHTTAQNSGAIKYCNNYVMIHRGVSQSTLHTIDYYRVYDGRLYSTSGHMCSLYFKPWYVRILGRDIFNQDEIPLTCETPPKDIVCPENCPSLECAVGYNEINSVKRLLELGQDPNEKTQHMNSISMLMYAIERRNYEIAEILIQKRANANFQNKSGKAALHELAESISRDSAFFKTFTLLMKNGADINIKDNNGGTPLHFSMNWTRTEPDEIRALKMFLENGANPNIKTIDGDTVLGWYLSMGSPSKKIVQILLDYNADPFIKNNEGKTPYDIAKERSLEDIVQLLK